MSNGYIDDNGTYLSNLIKEIIRSGEENWRSSDSEAVKDFASRFIKYYTDGNYNMYSASYRWLLDAEDGTDEYLGHRLGLIEEYLKNVEDLPDRVLEKFIKLRDYITLEAARSERYKSMRELSDRAEKKLSEIEEIAQKAEEERKDSAGQTITVLSIFTGIAMAFFGGFSLLGSAFDNIEHGLSAAAVMAILVGIVLFNTVFSFIYFASRISGHRISNCKAETCDECTKICYDENQNFFIRGLRKHNTKYPYIVNVNILLVVLLVVFLVRYTVWG